MWCICRSTDCRFSFYVLLSCTTRPRQHYRVREECTAGYKLQKVACVVCVLFWSGLAFRVIKRLCWYSKFFKSLSITHLVLFSVCITCATSSLVIMVITFLYKGNRRDVGLTDVFYRRLTFSRRMPPKSFLRDMQMPDYHSE